MTVRVVIDGVEYVPRSLSGDCQPSSFTSATCLRGTRTCPVHHDPDVWLEPRPYVAANLLALLDALRPHGFDTGDWFGQLRGWAMANGADDATPNADYADKLQRLAGGPT